MNAEEEFEADQGALTEPMAEREAKAMAQHAARWENELGVDFDEIQREVDRNPEAYELPDIRLEHLELELRARDFTHDLWRWLKEHDLTKAGAANPVEVVQHFSYFIGGKIHRALQGLAEEEPLELDSDAYGSAKAALLGLERMREAWQQLVAERIVTQEDAAPFVATIAWLIQEIDRFIPEARAFVRPGFDELDELRKLEEEERNSAAGI